MKLFVVLFRTVIRRFSDSRRSVRCLLLLFLLLFLRQLIRLHQCPINEISQSTLLAMNEPGNLLVALVFHLQALGPLVSSQQVPGTTRHVLFNLGGIL